MTSSCMAEHPADPTLHCNRPGSDKRHQHDTHAAYSPTEDQYVYWENEDYVPTARETKRATHEKNKGLLRSIRHKMTETRNE